MSKKYRSPFCRSVHADAPADRYGLWAAGWFPEKSTEDTVRPARATGKPSAGFAGSAYEEIAGIFTFGGFP
jgi:hypothetical protein